MSKSTISLEAQLSFISEEVGMDVPLQTIRTFLFVAHSGSCNQKQIEEALGFSNASASRNVSFWASIRFDHKPGMNFIARVEDPNDRRYRILTLTKTGREFMDRLRKSAGA